MIFEVISRLDVLVLNYLYSIRSLPASLFFIDVTAFGDAVFIVGLTLAICAWFILSKRYADIIGLSVAVFGTAVAELLLKHVVNRLRPDVLHYQAYVEGPYYSFPSAHAGLSMALYGFIMYFIFQTFWTPTKKVLFVVLPILILLVGFSRLYLGVHYLSDVIAGYFIGACFIWLGRFARLATLRFFSH